MVLANACMGKKNMAQRRSAFNEFPDRLHEDVAVDWVETVKVKGKFIEVKHRSDRSVEQI